VIERITVDFIPVRIHVREQPEAWKRFGDPWTPTQIFLDPDGIERHRVEGFLPVDDFLAQLDMARAKIDFDRGRFDEAGRHFRDVVEHHAGAGAAPEAAYWAGVSRYKASHDPAALGETAKAVGSRYPKSPWAKKASVWG